MHRIIVRALLLAGIIATSGCIAVSAKENRFGPECETVVVNDRVYVVNMSTGKVGEIDLGQARPFKDARQVDDSDLD